MQGATLDEWIDDIMLAMAAALRHAALREHGLPGWRKGIVCQEGRCPWYAKDNLMFIVELMTASRASECFAHFLKSFIAWRTF